jgi:hypothetical protein
MIGDACHLSLAARQGHGVERLLLVYMRQECQHSDAYFLGAIGEDVGAWMAEVVTQSDKRDMWQGCHGALDDRCRLPLITAYHQQARCQGAERARLQIRRTDQA